MQSLLDQGKQADTTAPVIFATEGRYVYLDEITKSPLTSICSAEGRRSLETSFSWGFQWNKRCGGHKEPQSGNVLSFFPPSFFFASFWSYWTSFFIFHLDGYSGKSSWRFDHGSVAFATTNWEFLAHAARDWRTEVQCRNSTLKSFKYRKVDP